MTELWEELRRTYVQTAGTKDDIWRAVADRARELLAAPDRPKMMIEGMTFAQFNAELRRMGLTPEDALKAAGYISDLANTPAQTVDEDGPAKRLAWEWYLGTRSGLPRAYADAEQYWRCEPDDKRNGWRVAHRLANTPAPLVDEDGPAKRIHNIIRREYPNIADENFEYTSEGWRAACRAVAKVVGGE